MPRCNERVNIVPDKVDTYCTYERGHAGPCGPKALVNAVDNTVQLPVQTYVIPKKEK